MRVPIVLLAGLLLAACGSSKSASTSEGAASAAPSGVHVIASSDWGRTKVTEGRGPAGSVLAATQGIADVETTYGGRYVSAIDGARGDGEREWVFWLNGIEADVGAAELEAGPDDRVWWDLHLWQGRAHVPAVVGQWPAPLSKALRRAVTGVTADPAMVDALDAAGVTATAPADTTGPRAIAGANDRLAESDPVWRAALADPRSAGLTVWFEDGEIVVWDAETDRVVPVPAARAILVATTEGFVAKGDPVVVIAGRTDADAQAAAAALAANPQLPQRHAAICLTEEALIACSGGQGLTL